MTTVLPSLEIFEPARSVWGTSLQPAGCPACGQAHLVESGRLGQPCPNCGRGKLEPQPARLRPEPPERLLPFRVQTQDLGPILERFLKPVWLRPDSLTTGNLLQRLTPLYLPMWLVDADVEGEWQAEAGYDYQVQSSQEAFSDGGWKTRQVVETRVRWEPRMGQIRRHYDNAPVPALSDHARLVEKTGPFRMSEARPFELGDLQDGASVRVPDQPPESAWPLAKDTLEKAASADCLQAAGAQHIRRFTIHAGYANLCWTQLLLPVYSTQYAGDNGASQIILINGQTGAIAGPRLASQRKGWQLAGISAAIAAGLFLLSLLLLALAVPFPPAAPLSILGFIVAFGAGVFAIIPAVWPWWWNHNQ